MVVHSIDYGNSVGNMFLIKNPTEDIKQILNLTPAKYRRMVSVKGEVCHVICGREIRSDRNDGLLTTKGERNPLFTYLLARLRKDRYIN